MITVVRREDAGLDTAEERFWAHVRKTRTHWYWTGAIHKGYGQFTLRWWRRADGAWRCQTVRAHRYAYELLVGPIPPGMTVEHTCKVRDCLRPDHLELLSRGENARRGISLTTKCKAGLHDWVEENIIRRPSRPATSGECRACANTRRRKEAA